MCKHLVLGCLCLSLVFLITSCGAGGSGGLTAKDWATVGAYQQQVAELNTKTAVLLAAVPGATPVVPFAQGWRIAMDRTMRLTSLANYSRKSGDPLTLKAHGVFLVLRLVVVNAQLQPVDRFPWWNLRLRDSAGRIFSPPEDATTSYQAADPTFERLQAYQPGLVYNQAVVFDIPPDATGLELLSEDGTFHLMLPLSAAGKASPPAAPSPLTGVRSTPTKPVGSSAVGG